MSLAKSITDAIKDQIETAVIEALESHLEPYAVEDSDGNALDYESRVDSDGDLFIMVTLDTSELDTAKEWIEELEAEVNDLKEEIAKLKEKIADLRNAD